MLKIGNLKLNTNVLMAPMAGITDLPFRMLIRKYGCPFAFTEMIDCNSVIYNNRNTLLMLASNSKDRPLGLQLLAPDEDSMLKAVLGVLEKKDITPCFIDINAGCPVKKVVKKHAGAYLLKYPKKIAKIVNVLVKNIDLPITVKIRSGWCKKSINAVETAQYIQDAGASAIFIHGRDRDQGYRGEIDYDIIKQVKDTVNIPVIGSGNVWDCQHAKQMYEQTGCDGILAARGALGNPWIFKEIEDYLSKGKLPKKHSVEEVKKTVLEHMKLSTDFYGEKFAITRMRKFVRWYLKSIPNVKSLRRKIDQIKYTKDFEMELKSL